MATVTFSAAGRPNANPFLDSAVTGFTSVGAAGALISSQTWLGANSSANTLWRCDTNPAVDSFSAYIVAGDALSNTKGVAFFNSSGNGFMFIARNTDIRVFALAAYVLSGSALATYSITQLTDDVIRVDLTQSTGTYVVKQNGTTRGTFINTTYTSGLVSGMLSRGGALKSFTLDYIPAQTVTSINGGSPITSSQSAVAADTTGFTGLPTTITTNATGVTCGTISGTTNAPTWVQTVRTDGAVFPKSGTVVTYTFVNGSETASGDETIEKDTDQTAVIVASPINDDITCLFGAIFAATGRSAANGDEVYHTVPAGMSDLVINPDGTMEVTNAGTFDCWVWTLATGVNYYYSVTITENGIVINGGLTSSGLTVSGLTLAGSTSAGL